MKLGCSPGIVPGLVPRRNFEEQLAAISEIGFEYVEAWNVVDGACMMVEYGLCPSLSFDMNPIKILKMLEKYHLKMAAVCAHASLLPVQGLPVYGLQQIKRAIRFASDLNAPMVITAEGSFYPQGLPRSKALEILKPILEEIMLMADDFDMIICIEPCGGLTSDPEALNQILDLYPSSNLGVNFDPANVQLSGFDPVDALKQVVHKVFYMHMKDLPKDTENLPAGKLWAPVGSGKVNIDAIVDILHKAGYDGVLTCEVDGVEDARQSFEYLQNKLATLN